MDTFEINKIKQKLRDLKKYLIGLLILETYEKIEDRFELYDEVIKTKIKLFTLIKEYFSEQYYEFEKITTIQYNKFSKKNLAEIKSKFFEFYNSFLLLIKKHVKIEKVNQFNNEEEKKNETDYKKMKYNVLKDDEENNWDNSYENLNLNLYETKSDTTNKYNTTLNFDYSSSLNSIENDF